MARKAAVYEPVKMHLKRCIEDGVFEAGDMLPSESALMDRFGLSRHQVRHALRELEIEGYLERSQGRGSFVTPQHARPDNAVRLYGRRTVAIAFPHYKSLYVRQLIEGFIQRVLDAGYQVVIQNMRYEDDSEYEYLRQAPESGIAGLAAWIGRPQPRTTELLDAMKANGFPVVLMDRYIPNVPLDYAGSDNVELGYRLTRALIDRGHQHIGFVNIVDVPLTSVAERFEGYRKALAEADLPVCETLETYLTPDQDSGTMVVMQTMAQKERPTAFFAVNDLVALDLAAVLSRLGYDVGTDIAIASVDDDHVTEDKGLPMLRVAQQGRVIGQTAGDLLASRIADPALSPRSMLIEAGPVIDESEVTTASEQQEGGVPASIPHP